MDHRTILQTLELSPDSQAAVHALKMYFPSTSNPGLFHQALEYPAQVNRLVFNSLPQPRFDQSGYTNRLCVSPKPQVPHGQLRTTVEIEESRQNLPIWGYKDKIMEMIDNNKVVFIQGATGSGKTTQIPQFILDHATLKSLPTRIICSVPLRIEAISSADRVALERGESVGFTVGYQIRLESKYSPCNTLLTYCTNGVLMRSLTSFDYSILKNITHLIIDELQFAEAQTDFLLACLKDMNKNLPHLKIILLGAEMDFKLIQQYFGGLDECPLLHLDQRSFPVEVFFLEDVLYLLQTFGVDNGSLVDLDLVLQMLHWIHRCTEKEEAVLIFLPGYEEVVTLKQMIFTSNSVQDMWNTVVVFLLHQNIQSGDQKAVFEKPRPGTRKVILATCVAEMSMTVEDVVYVVDCGKNEEKVYDNEEMKGVERPRGRWISKASANRRRARAGRSKPGKCFRLYSTSIYSKMREFPVPEIFRSSPQKLCLYARGFIRSDMKILDFFSTFPQRPNPNVVKKAITNLISIDALDPEEQLTRLGIFLLDIPIEPYLGKALVYALVMKCLDPVLTIITFISHRDPFKLPANLEERRKALDIKLKFSADAMSDHMAALKAFQDWEKSKLFRDGVQYQFCREHYLSSACFEMVYGIRAQLLGQLRACGFVSNSGPCGLRDLNVNSDNWALVKGILVSTLYPNVCSVDRKMKCLFNDKRSKIQFDPCSVVAVATRGSRGVLGLPTDWVLYDDHSMAMSQVQDKKVGVRNCTVVSDLAFAVFAGSFDYIPDVFPLPKEHCNQGRTNAALNLTKQPQFYFDLNSWISFQGSKVAMDFACSLRMRVKELVNKRLSSAPFQPTQTDELALKVIALSLQHEDEASEFCPVTGIEQWPKFVAGNMMSAPRAGYERSQAVSDDLVGLGALQF